MKPFENLTSIMLSCKRRIKMLEAKIGEKTVHVVNKGAQKRAGKLNSWRSDFSKGIYLDSDNIYSLLKIKI